MTEDELKELWWQKEGFLTSRWMIEKQIDKDFSEVLGMRLSFQKKSFITSCSFLRDYDNEAIVLMSGYFVNIIIIKM